MKTTVLVLSIAGMFLVAFVRDVSAANSTFYTDLASFSAAAGGPLVSQDFSSYPHGTNLRNVEILPGVSVDTNMPTLEAFSASGITMFGGGGGREAPGNAYYDINLALPHRAVASETDAFDAEAGNPSTAQDAGLLTVFFTDATSTQQAINGNATGSAIFRGIVSDTPISSIRWAEAHELSGGNEETALDNFSVLRSIPEPASGMLCGAMLVPILLVAWRRRAG